MAINVHSRHQISWKLLSKMTNKTKLSVKFMIIFFRHCCRQRRQIVREMCKETKSTKVCRLRLCINLRIFDENLWNA